MGKRDIALAFVTFGPELACSLRVADIMRFEGRIDLRFAIAPGAGDAVRAV
jgi:hypothetical protein